MSILVENPAPTAFSVPFISDAVNNHQTSFPAPSALPSPGQHLAAVSPKVGDYPSIQHVPTPDIQTLRPGEALVMVHFAGVCHSDVAFALGHGVMLPMEPIISGHEGAGYIVGLGEHTRSGPAPKIGDRVGIKMFADTCMTCDACLAGDEESCSAFVVTSTSHLIPIPDEVPLYMAAPILCAGLSTYKALLNAHLRPGDWVVVPGAGGGLGHLAVQYALAMNYRVVGIDTGEDKRALLEGYGIHKFIDFMVEKVRPSGGIANGCAQDIASRVKEMTGGHARAAIVTAGSIGPYKQALTYLGYRGTLVCVGLPKGTVFEVDPAAMVVNSFRIVGSSLSNRAEAKEALAFVAMGKVKVELTYRHMSEIADVYKELEAGQVRGRVVIEMPGSPDIPKATS